MNMRISGWGNVPEGDYEKIKIRGRGKLFGNVRCASFSASGTTKGEAIVCTQQFKTAGSSSFSRSIKARSMRASGAISCAGDISADETISLHGSVKCSGNIKCDQLSVAGSLKVDGDVEAESIKTAGIFNCAGLVNAESIQIKCDKLMKIGSIGGSNIQIKRKRISVFANRRLIVSSSIEGDDVSVKHVTCPRVTGRIVNIGKGCDIELVQYTEEIKASPNAKIGRTEKV